jgi:aminoglycoside phosphotransferase (APT) family kinase protein
MSGRLRRVGEEARKTQSDQGSVTPEMLLARATALSRAGVPTPIGRYDRAHNELVFPWIVGVTGEAYLRQQIESAAADGFRDVPPAKWQRLMAPLVGLHGSDPSAIELRPLDSWRKIHPRIEAVTLRYGPSAPFIRQVEACSSLCARALEIVNRQGGPRATVVHGDYHLRQILIEGELQTPWLLDLDDLALGPRESDLGNVAAPSPRIYGDWAMQEFSTVLTEVQEAYQRAGGQPTDRDSLLAHGAVALLRRALKGWEQDDDRKTADTILAIAATAAKGAIGAG